MVCILQSFPEQQLRSLTGEHWSFLPNRLTYELPLASFVHDPLFRNPERENTRSRLLCWWDLWRWEPMRKGSSSILIVLDWSALHQTQEPLECFWLTFGLEKSNGKGITQH
jgi:hypothetical protein